MDRPPDLVAEAAARGRYVGTKKLRKSRKKKKRHSHQRIRAPPATATGAFSIEQFCIAHGGMSLPMYFKLQKMGLGPREMRVGRRTMISVEAATEWREVREAEALAGGAMAMMTDSTPILTTPLPVLKLRFVTAKLNDPHMLKPFANFVTNDGGEISLVATFATEVAAVQSHKSWIRNREE